MTITACRRSGAATGRGYYTACHYAVMAALTALVHRLGSGEGQFIDVSMHQASNLSTEGGSYSWLVAKDTVQRKTGRHASSFPTSESQVRLPRRHLALLGRAAAHNRRNSRGCSTGCASAGSRRAFPEAVLSSRWARSPKPARASPISASTDEATAIFSAGRDALVLIAEVAGRL